jgi:hypothetical protein
VGASPIALHLSRAADPQGVHERPERASASPNPANPETRTNTMTKTITQFSALWLVLLLIGIAGPGCKSTPRRITYTTLSSVAVAVDTARAVYVDTYRAGKVNAETHTRVLKMDLAYTEAMHSAIRAAQYEWSAPVSDDLIRLARELIETIQTVKETP